MAKRKYSGSVEMRDVASLDVFRNVDIEGSVTIELDTVLPEDALRGSSVSGELRVRCKGLLTGKHFSRTQFDRLIVVGCDGVAPDFLSKARGLKNIFIYPHIAIPEGFLRNCKKLKSISAASVVSVGDNFGYFPELTSINFSYVNSVGKNFLAGCHSLSVYTDFRSLLNVGEGFLSGVKVDYLDMPSLNSVPSDFLSHSILSSNFRLLIPSLKTFPKRFLKSVRCISYLYLGRIDDARLYKWLEGKSIGWLEADSIFFATPNFLKGCHINTLEIFSFKKFSPLALSKAAIKRISYSSSFDSSSLVAFRNGFTIEDLIRVDGDLYKIYSKIDMGSKIAYRVGSVDFDPRSSSPRLQRVYVVFDVASMLSAHGEKLSSAFSDLDKKLNASFVESAYRHLCLTDRFTFEQSVNLYQDVTKACNHGISEFLRQAKFPIQDTYSIAEIIEYTRGYYGHEKMVKVFGEKSTGGNSHRL